LDIAWNGAAGGVAWPVPGICVKTRLMPDASEIASAETRLSIETSTR
jgi:hypothetical protein